METERKARRTKEYIKEYKKVTNYWKRYNEWLRHKQSVNTWYKNILWKMREPKPPYR